ncbi:hypothetical protein OV203_36555 [Nannocystis sp. ILAH1]|uniref:hypothetical protein n=1 Tax=unclassified Nannocystis TaxID=2627009 RepID=UPI00226FB37F|nr:MULTISPECIES: hypothetical protein [unclassified Nannocystis]MCY0992709.1 hypothetical protein [Nannocystis sp. ILAH1]MCY1070062.1 hypothetical protein [Nannocystis sp. RBIL2]
MHSLRYLTCSALAAFALAACPSKSQDTDTDPSTSAPTGTTTDATEGVTSTTTTTGTSSSSVTEPATTTTTDATTDTTTTTTTTGGIEPGGANPCGACAEGEYCYWQPAEQPECADTQCKAIPQECADCFAAPLECDGATMMSCASSRCYMELFEKVELADDGVVVVHCGLWADTGCGS